MYKATTTAAMAAAATSRSPSCTYATLFGSYKAVASGGDWRRDGAVGSSVPAGPNILARQHVNLLDGFDEFTEDQSKKG